MNDALIEQLLVRAQRVAQQAEVYAVTFRETPVSFEANRLKSLMTREGAGLALRIVKDGRTGFASTTRTDQLEELVNTAVEIAQFGAPAKFELGSYREQDYPRVELFDPAVEAESAEAMVELGQAMIDRVTAHTPEVLCEAGVSKRVSTVRIMNSAGGDVRWTKSEFDVSLEGTLIRGTDILFVGDDRSDGHPIARWEVIANETVRQLELARETAAAPAGRLPVIFTPRAAATVFILPLTVALNGRTVVQGASPLGQKLGEQVFDPRLSVWDDPAYSFKPGSRFADDEGVPARRLDLIERGKVGTFVYDLQTAGLAGVKSTGSASRSLGSLPTPGYSLLRVAAGDLSFDRMVAGMQDGLIVDQLLGGGQGNVLGGEFGGNVLLGYRVQNGQITGRVKNTLIAGNIYEAFRAVGAIGSVPEWVHGSMEIPHIMVNDVAVSSEE